MNKIFTWIENNLDKVTHFSVSINLVIIISAIFSSVIWGSLVSIILGIIKEIIDLTRGRGFDTKDLLADLSGVIIGSIITILIL